MINLVAFDYNSVDLAHVPDFDMTFRPVTRPIGTWKQELNCTVAQIQSVTDRPLLLFMGGGIDSEVVARAMLDQGIEFTAITVRHKDGANNHDTVWADEFCQTHGITQMHHEFDAEWFFNHRVPELRRQGFVSRRPWRYFQIYLVELAESLRHTGLICSGEQIYKTVNDEICSTFSSEYVMALRYCQEQDIVHFPYVHLHNSELLAAYMQTDIIKLLLSDADNFRCTKFNTSVEKILIYHRYYPEMSRREKADGFEHSRIYHEFIRKHRLLYPGFVDYNMPVSRIRQQLGID